MLFTPLLRHTPTFQPRLKLCSENAKTSYFDQYARPTPKRNLLRYFFISTVTKHQKSAAQSHSHSHIYYIRVIQLTLLEITCDLTSPPLFVSLLPFRVRFPSHFQTTLLSQHTLLVVTSL